MRMQRWRNGSGTFRMNVALSRTALLHGATGQRRSSHRRHHPGAQPRLYGSRLAGRPRPWLEPRARGRGADPLDPRRHAGAHRAPHVASLFCQHVAPELPDGKSWDDHRDEVADLMIATVDQYAPGFAASVIGRQILSPLDLERQFGLLGGDIFHGALTLEPAVLGAADAGPCGLSRPAEGPLPLRLRRPSRRRRHRRPRPQRRQGDPGGSPRPVQKPWIGLWIACGTEPCWSPTGHLRRG